MTDHEIDRQDSTLVALAKTGSASAIDQLVCKYWPVAYRTAARVLGNHADAEEIAQDTLASAIAHLASFYGNASFRTWLHRIAVNHSLMLLRRRRRRTDFSSPISFEAVASVLGGPPTPQELLLEEERQRLVEEGIERLPDCYRTVLQLSECEGRSAKEIAARLGLSASAVKTRLNRGRAFLRLQISRRFRVDSTANSEPGRRVQKPSAVPGSLACA